MSGRLVTDAKLLALLRLLGRRFTVADLNRALPKAGITSATQARHWLLYHRPNQPALVRVADRVKKPRGRPAIVYEVTEYGETLMGIKRCAT